MDRLTTFASTYNSRHASHPSPFLTFNSRRKRRSTRHSVSTKGGNSGRKMARKSSTATHRFSTFPAMRQVGQPHRGHPLCSLSSSKTCFSLYFPFPRSKFYLCDSCQRALRMFCPSSPCTTLTLTITRTPSKVLSSHRLLTKIIALPSFFLISSSAEELAALSSLPQLTPPSLSPPPLPPLLITTTICY